MTAEADTKRGVVQRADGLEDRMESSDEEAELERVVDAIVAYAARCWQLAMPQEGIVYASGERRVASLSLAST